MILLSCVWHPEIRKMEVFTEIIVQTVIFRGAVSNDINVGLYFFSQALNETEARGEAQYVLDMIDQYGWNVSMPIIMDREAGANKRLTAGKLSKTKETAVCQAFADTITAAGYRAGVYASYAWIKKLYQYGCFV